jgi:hypothetical protein
MSDPIRVNGNLFSWGSILVTVDGEVITGFTEITYGDKRERVEGYGLGSHHGPLGRSAGKYSTDESNLKGKTHAVAHLRNRLAALAADGRSYGSVEFQVDIFYGESDLDSHSVNLLSCVVTADSASRSEGADPLEDELKLKPLYIYRDGTTLFDSSTYLP